MVIHHFQCFETVLTYFLTIWRLEKKKLEQDLFSIEAEACSRFKP